MARQYFYVHKLLSGENNYVPVNLTHVWNRLGEERTAEAFYEEFKGRRDIVMPLKIANNTISWVYVTDVCYQEVEN